ncbi:probable BOI-related E3 ubiquitin-protein ligase 2 [Phoenix dactylifera]|uniref:Probable BOI-related E3 ubiquitin-protein ligase 2 n=1 Tax=Phoenix dactylifera TaxID=42345 RepID=A0A8B7CZQ4_PHODC|nr:probable BOI-related E3 ubiquitin-protein ligase 2 [Phoenix dactylifera]
MAVEAQNRSSAFAPDYRGRDRDSLFVITPSNALLEAHVRLGEQQKILINGAGISDPESELTRNASGSRKRSRDDGEVMVLPQAGHCNNHQQQQQMRFATVINPNYAGLQLFYEQSRLQGSAGTSTSGRLPAIPPLVQDLVSHLDHQSLEIDALIGFQSEKFRSGLEEARKRHCRALMSILEQRAEKRLKEKEAELESVSRRNAELEEKARQVEAESQIWFNMAKNNEAIAASLRTTLDQVLLRNAAGCGGGRPKEGYGDSDGAPFPADDAQSCCFEDEAAVAAAGGIFCGGREELRWRRSCKVCGEKEVTFVLLPCRHLCLCKDCESMTDTCPICQAWKNASFQIFMP